jgi:hypothetical protein
MAFSAAVDGTGIDDAGAAGLDTAGLFAARAGAATAGDGETFASAAGVATGGDGETLAGDAGVATPADGGRAAGGDGVDPALCGGASTRVEGEALANVPVGPGRVDGIAGSAGGTADCRGADCAFETDGTVSAACDASLGACGGTADDRDGGVSAAAWGDGVGSEFVVAASEGARVAYHVAVATASTAMTHALATIRRPLPGFGLV